MVLKLSSKIYTVEELKWDILHPVIVHCAMGIQRSASVIACYLLNYGIINGVQNTLDFIRSKRKVAFSTGYNFLPAIKGYKCVPDSGHF